MGKKENREMRKLLQIVYRKHIFSCLHATSVIIFDSEIDFLQLSYTFIINSFFAESETSLFENKYELL